VAKGRKREKELEDYFYTLVEKLMAILNWLMEVMMRSGQIIHLILKIRPMSILRFNIKYERKMIP
jgi:hypothetical protein